jgi:hypothetical protein
MQKQEEGKTMYAVPYSIDMKWTDKTKLRDIVNAMIAAGFPREWEWSEKESDRGPRKITAETLKAAMNSAGWAVGQ